MSDILHRVGIDAKPDKVFDALTTIEGLRGWWSGTAAGSAAKGGLTNYGFCDMQVIDAEPSKLVHWRCTGGPDEWLDTEVTFRLDWKNGQTFVVFKHANWKEPVEFMHHCSTKWATFLLSLRDLVEKADGHPLPNDLRIEVNERM
jgi:uncharacterized protein YndB with AHSA1/START domain